MPRRRCRRASPRCSARRSIRCCVRATPIAGAAVAVKKFAQKHPHKMMKDWPASGSKARVAHMQGDDFYGSETSTHHGAGRRGADRVRRRRRRHDGAQGQAGAAGGRGDRQRRDERRRAARVLRQDHGRGQERGRAALAAPQGDHDEGLRPGDVRSLRRGLLPGRPREACRRPAADRRQREQRSRGRAGEAGQAARREEGRDRGRHRRRSTPRVPRWPWSTRARASPTCTSPTTSSSMLPCPTSCATAAGCGTTTTRCRTPSP